MRTDGLIFNFLGDSITGGCSVDIEHNRYDNVLKEMCALKEVRNYGVGGTNDYGHGDAPFGQIGDRDRNTFCGAVRCLMEILVRRYPNAKLIFMTPERRLGDEAPSKSIHRYVEGLPLKNYVDAIKEIAKDYPIAVLDMYEKLDINPNQEADLLAYTAEGLHFNDAGHLKIAECLREFLIEL